MRLAMVIRAGAALGLALGLAAPSGASPERPVIQSVLQPFVDRSEIAGAVVLVADRDSILEFEAVGFADLATQRPMETDALFWLASTSKPFVATAVMMLVEEGRIDLDAPVSTYLPDFQPGVALDPASPGDTATRPAAQAVTTRMLLSHSSGMYSGSPADAPTLDALPLADRVASYGALLQAEPGTQFIYGNADINTAGRIVEIASGMPYEQFLRTRLLEPLGMAETGSCPGEALLQRLPTAYFLPAEGTVLAETAITFLRYPLSDCANRHSAPSADLFSTAADLARFASMLLNGGVIEGRRYLSQASIDEMTRNQLAEDVRRTVPLSAPPDNMGYGLGWAVSLDGSYFHPGTGMTDIRIDPGRRVATILLMQSTAPKSFEARAALFDASDARYAVETTDER